MSTIVGVLDFDEVSVRQPVGDLAYASVYLSTLFTDWRPTPVAVRHQLRAGSESVRAHTPAEGRWYDALVLWLAIQAIPVRWTRMDGEQRCNRSTRRSRCSLSPSGQLGPAAPRSHTRHAGRPTTSTRVDNRNLTGNRLLNTRWLPIPSSIRVVIPPSPSSADGVADDTIEVPTRTSTSSAHGGWRLLIVREHRGKDDRCR